jgi:hypothetical protein
LLGARLGSEFLPALEEGNLGSAPRCRRPYHWKPVMPMVDKIRTMLLKHLK